MGILTTVSKCKECKEPKEECKCAKRVLTDYK